MIRSSSFSNKMPVNPTLIFLKPITGHGDGHVRHGDGSADLKLHPNRPQCLRASRGPITRIAENVTGSGKSFLCLVPEKVIIELNSAIHVRILRFTNKICDSQTHICDSLEAQGCRYLRFTTLRATFSAIQF